MTLGIAAMAALAGCPSGRIETRSNETRSQELLREGLEAQRRGDEPTAQAKMEEALRVDALNARARTALSSLHAGRAGVVMARLVEPIYLAADDLDSDARRLAEERRLTKVAEIKARLEGTRSAARAAASPSAAGSTSSSSSTVRAAELDAKAQERLDEATLFGEKLSQFAVQANFFLFVMNAMPLITNAKRPYLERAIEVLREDSLAPQRRSEEARLYLAILGAVRFTADLRAVVGAAPVRAGDLERLRASLCALDSAAARKRIAQVRASLALLEEGLTPSPEDPDTAKRRARKRLQLALTGFLDNEIFRRTEEFFDETKRPGAVAREVVGLWCDEVPQGRATEKPKAAP